MNGSYQAVSGRVLGHRPHRTLNPLRHKVLSLLVGGMSCLLTVGAYADDAAVAPADSLASPVDATAIPTALPAPAPTLIGLGTQELLGNTPFSLAPTGSNAPIEPFKFPEVTSSQPVAIPFPTAVHLFVPGAIMAIYATRRFRGRRR